MAVAVAGHGSGGGAQWLDSGYILEVQLSALAAGFDVGWRNEKNQQQRPGFGPEPPNRVDRPLRSELFTWQVGSRAKTTELQCPG